MRHIESGLQKACVFWFRIQYPSMASSLFSVPNGGWRSPVEAAIMKGEGMVAGVADLILLMPNGNHHALCIEMKRPGGKQSESQKEWQKEVESHGYAYAVVCYFEEFKQLITDYFHDMI